MAIVLAATLFVRPFCCGFDKRRRLGLVFLFGCFTGLLLLVANVYIEVYLPHKELFESRDFWEGKFWSKHHQVDWHGSLQNCHANRRLQSVVATHTSPTCPQLPCFTLPTDSMTVTAGVVNVNINPLVGALLTCGI